MTRIPLLKNVRERAKSIVAEADSLIETHGKTAFVIARDFERHANSLGGALYWHAVRKVVSTRIASEVDLLPPEQSSNCVACLVERISMTEDGGSNAMPLACVSCLAKGLGRALQNPGARPLVIDHDASGTNGLGPYTNGHRA